MQVLVVDDKEVIRQLLEEELTLAGHEVLEAEDGEEAWEILQEQHVGLVITDWMMPRVDGPELIRRIRSADFPGYTYIILLTARSDQDEVVAGLEVGADDYLTKPFDLRELQARVAIGERILALEQRLRRTLVRLEILATHDNLTGLLNRQAIMKHARMELLRAKRARRPLCLVMADIDFFKKVNDEHGHLVGDQVLQLVATTINNTIRPYDRAGRWGGEEFLLVLPETTQSQAVVVANRLREAIAGDYLPLGNGKGGHLSVSLSLGVAEVDPANPVSLRALLQQADDALYHAKQAGRDRVCPAA